MHKNKQITSGRSLLLRMAAVILTLLLACALWHFYRGRPDILPYEDLTGTPRQAAQGREFAVVTGTPWATAAAVRVLEENGTACDAAIAALLVINVTHGEAAAFGGVAPTLYFDSATRQANELPSAASLLVWNSFLPR